MRRALAPISVFLISLIWIAAPSRADVLPRAEVDRLIKPAIDGKWLNALTVGLIDAHGRQVIGYGSISDDKASLPDGRTIFEIGSVSKTFTATLLADAVLRGKMSLDDPVQKYLPAGVKMPVGEKGQPITLLHLTTQCSGLPRMPSNFAPADPANPYADYTVRQMYDYLSALRLQHDPGEQCLYSNLGVALLGHVLALRAGKSYEDLLIERICQPLKMQSTRVTFDGSMRKRLAPPHDGDGTQVKNWDLPTFAGAGGIRSDTDDMLDYVAAEINPGKTEVQAAMRMTQKRQRAFGPGADIGMNWIINPKSGVRWHNGQTGGYHSFVAFHPEKRVGVVILCNTGCGLPDEIGSRLMQRMLGSPIKPLSLRKIVSLPDGDLDRLAGRYKFGLLAWMDVKRAGDHLTAQLTGQPAAGIYPESQTKFFWKVVDAQVTFEIDAAGHVTGLVLHQNGRDVPAKKAK